MEIKLTPQESEEYFYNALCNGLSYISGYGLEIDVDELAYAQAKKQLVKQKKNICYEDVFMQMLRDGDKLTFKDIEGDGAYTRSICLKDVHNRVQKTPLRHLQAMINEEDDADTADVILQSVFFEDIIFG